jgi:hypothetical protein
MTDYERRCRRLLRAYPADYRAERGDEIIDTLIEAHPDRTRPTVRDAVALVAGGLRVRATENRRLPLRTNLRLAVLFGATAVLVMPEVWFVSSLLFDHGYRHAAVFMVGALIAIAVAVVSAWLGQTRWTVVAGVVGVLALAIEPARDAPEFQANAYVSQLPLAVALVAVVLLARPTPRPHRAWLWFLVPFAGPEVLPYSWTERIAPLAAVIVIGTLVVAFFWIAIDVRPAVGFALYFIIGMANDEVRLLVTGGSQSPRVDYVVVSVIAALLVPALLRMRRQQRV